MATYPDALLALRTLQEARWALAAVYGVQLYEWFASLEEEIRLIYRSKWTSVKVAYLLCRYYPLVVWPIIVWAYVGNHDGAFCTLVLRPVHALFAPFQFFSQAVMGMRAYAFSGRKRKVLVLLSTCYAILVGVDIWVFFTGIEPPPPLFYIVFGKSGCFPNYGDGFLGLRLGVSMIAAVLMDLVSLCVVILYSRQQSARGSLARTFVNQGLGAFASVSAVNIGTALIYFEPRSFHSGVGLPFMLIVSSAVACRVILQLRAKGAVPTDTEISRRHSLLIRNAFGGRSSPTTDLWAIENPAATRPQGYHTSTGQFPCP
ncbi:hypothetical protein BD779DRAFT_516624 [Infundibulicybe gibba]|nr:hypothetical protein BD779DRAFT_516624 [Infundibulicybe gibba]